jgi:hypothetical protein
MKNMHTYVTTHTGDADGLQKQLAEVNISFRRNILNQLILGDKYQRHRMSFFWGLVPRPPGSASPNFGKAMAFCEAEQRFCFFF